jgi:DNA-binding HxlR family transcriptional regulator
METKKQEGPDIFRSDCLSRSTLQLISNEWTPLIVFALEEGTLRFTQILKRIDGISTKMLTQTLRSMERNGLVKRVVHPVVPPIVEYSLTPLGQSLVEPVHMLQSWAYKHLEEVAQARMAYDQDDHPPIQEETTARVQQREQ